MGKLINFPVMKRFFAYFGFTKAERRGFSILMLLTFALGIIPFLYRYFNEERVLEHSVTYFLAADTEKDFQGKDVRFTPRDKEGKKRYEHISYFYFDPNGLSEADWQRLGFSAKQIAVIKNYEAKGGRFYKKEDVAKIYSISKEDYERIEPYILIKEGQRKSVKINEDKVDRKYGYREEIAPQLIDINEADTSDFKKLRGIGSVLSARMVKYRDVLGGFHAISQIGEVYGVAPEVYEQIAPLLVVGESHIKRLKVNTATKEQLGRHPYISKKQAMLIVNYRSQHGAFANLEDLRKIPVLDDDFFRKIEPYIEF